MFANQTAIETLVSTDAKASEDEKSAVLAALHRGEGKTGASVLSLSEAAMILGKPRKAMYNLLRNGTLKGFYSGRKHQRAMGITKASLDAAMAGLRTSAGREK